MKPCRLRTQTNIGLSVMTAEKNFTCITQGQSGLGGVDEAQHSSQEQCQEREGPLVYSHSMIS